MPVVPTGQPAPRPEESKPDDTYLLMAAATMEQMGRLNTNIKTNEHDPNWIGNKNYKDIFEAVDQANKTTKNPQFHTPGPMIRKDINPHYVPSQDRFGWNRVG